jgi:hypothetical protein
VVPKGFTVIALVVNDPGIHV